MNGKLKIFLGIFLTLVSLMLSGGFEMSLHSQFNSIPIGVGSQLGILLVSILLILFFSKKNIIQFRIDKPKIKKLMQPIGLVLLVLIIGQILAQFINNTEHPADSMSLIQKLVFIVILASLSEELLFRGFLLKMLKPLKERGIYVFKTRISLPVILSGVLFGLIHFAMLETGASFNFVILLVISAMFLGIIAGYYQEKYHNFIYAFIVHLSGNLMGLIYTLL
jgi:membrane protease YdiL (CAAX protease family)